MSTAGSVVHSLATSTVSQVRSFSLPTPLGVGYRIVCRYRSPFQTEMLFLRFSGLRFINAPVNRIPYYRHIL